MLLVLLLAGSGVVHGWNLGIGGAYRHGMRLKVQERSVKAKTGTELEIPGAPDVVVGNRVFDDGYVLFDSASGRPGALGSEYTWNWGYDAADQYDAVGKTLTFHRTEKYESDIIAVVQTVDNAVARDFGVAAMGGRLEGSDRIWESGDGRFSLVQNMALEFSGGTSRHLANRRFAEYRKRVSGQIVDVYSYDVSGVEFPECFHGTYLGPFDSPAVVPSPLIPTSPQSIDREFIPDSDDGQLSVGNVLPSPVRYECDADLLVMQYGVSLGWHPCGSLSFEAGGALLLGLADVKVSRCDQYSGKNRSKEATRILPGVGIQGAVIWNVVPKIAVQLFVGYQWFFSELEMSVDDCKFTFSADATVCGVEIVYEW